MNNLETLEILGNPNSSADQLANNIHENNDDIDLEERLYVLQENPIFLLLMLENPTHVLFEKIALARRNLTYKKLRELVFYISWDRHLLVIFCIDKLEKALKQVVDPEKLTLSCEIFTARLRNFWQRHATLFSVRFNFSYYIHQALPDYNKERLIYFLELFNGDLSKVEYHEFNPYFIHSMLYYTAGFLAYKDNDKNSQNWYSYQNNVLNDYIQELTRISSR